MWIPSPNYLWNLSLFSILISTTCPTSGMHYYSLYKTNKRTKNPNMGTTSFKSDPFQSINQASVRVFFFNAKLVMSLSCLKLYITLQRVKSKSLCIACKALLWSLFLKYVLPQLSWASCILQLQTHCAISDQWVFDWNILLQNHPTNPIAQLIRALLCDKLANIW